MPWQVALLLIYFPVRAKLLTALDQMDGAPDPFLFLFLVHDIFLLLV